MKRLLLGLISMIAILFSGCAISSKHTSYVDPQITIEDIQEIAIAATQQLATELPAARTTLHLEEMTDTSDPALITFDSIFSEKLRQTGFAIYTSENAFAPTEALMVTYKITPIENIGVLLSLNFGNNQINQLFQRTETGFKPVNTTIRR